jgi:hypothetical protein
MSTKRRELLTFGGPAVLLLVLLSPFLACGNSDATTSSNVAEGGAGDASAQDGASLAEGSSPTDGSTVDAPPGCDLAKDPQDEPACVDDSVGVFVAPNGADENDGTRAHPIKHIQAALAKTSLQKPRVYVCGGTYAEHVKITTGASVFGGFDCNGWSYAVTNVVRIAPADAGFALEVANATSTLTIEDVSITSADGASAVPSSVGVFAHGSSGVILRRVKVVTGDGFTGTSSTLGTNYSVDLAQSDTSITGLNASGTTGGGQQDCANLCTNGVHSTGGQGGTGGLAPTDGQPGKPPVVGTPGGLAGMMNVSCGGGGGGGDGIAGPAGTDAPPPTSLGTLDNTGWTPAGSGVATAGTPGQGGGGGGGHAVAGFGAGSGGGCGGCGGAAPSLATGGGGSIAVLVKDTPLIVAECTLAVGRGGAGGAGTTGQLGQLPGFSGTSSSGGCQGGQGGQGGTGGATAGGAGGVAIGVLYAGTPVPMVDAPTKSAITNVGAGAQGAGGKSPSLDGKPGVAKDVQDATQL